MTKDKILLVKNCLLMSEGEVIKYHVEPGDVFVRSSATDEFPQSSPFITSSLSDEDIELFLFKTTQ